MGLFSWITDRMREATSRGVALGLIDVGLVPAGAGQPSESLKLAMRADADTQIDVPAVADAPDATADPPAGSRKSRR